jgi:hypothetical protein
MDNDTKGRNALRQAQYKLDTSAGRVVTYNVRENGGELTEPFVSAAEQAENWRDKLSLVY